MAWSASSQPASTRSRVRPLPAVHLSELELAREKNVRENEAFLRSLGIGTIREEMQKAHAAQPQQVDEVSPGRMSLEHLRDKWVGREAQIDQLARLLPAPVRAKTCHSTPSAQPEGLSCMPGWMQSMREALPPVLLCYGPRGSGKTGVLKDLMQALEHPHAFIRGREHGSSKSLYGAIIREWLRHASQMSSGKLMCMGEAPAPCPWHDG